MKKPLLLLRVLLSWFMTFIVAVCVLVCLLFGNTEKVWRFWVRTWSTLALKILRIEIRITGKENLKGPAIVAMNHESILDIFVSPHVAPGYATFLAKKEVGKIPLVGRAMRACGCIFVDRSNTHRAVKSIQDGFKRLPSDASLLIYPEGTRSRDFKLRPLKKGICHMAIQSQLPILTVGQYGMKFIGGGDNNFFFEAGTLYLHVEPSIDTSSWKTESIDEHLEEVRISLEKSITKAQDHFERGEKNDSSPFVR